MKKVLFVVDERKLGGVSIVLENIFRAFPKENFDLLVLHDNGNCFSNNANVNMIYGSSFFNVCDLSLKELIKNKHICLVIKKLFLIFLLKTNLIKHFIRLERKKMNLETYDIEISFKDGFGTYFVAYGDAKKKLRWMHTDYSLNNPGRHYQKSYNKALFEFDKIIAISQSVADNFNNIYHLNNKTQVIHNIINAKKDIKIKKSDIIEFASIGRLAEIKGYDRVIEAINKLNNEGLFNNAIYKIVGDGPEKKHLESLVNKYQLENKVIFLGASSTPWKLLKNCDMFILSSYSEAFPTTVIESLVNGVPVLSVIYSSVYEMLNKKISIIVENSEDGIYNGIKSIINKPKIINDLKKELDCYQYNNNESIDKIKELME